MSQQSYENPQTPSVEPKAPIDRFFAAASIGMTRWWRWVVGVIVIAVFWMGIGALPFLTVTSVCGASSMEVDSPWFVCADGKLGASLIPDFVLAFLSFVVGFIGIWIAVKYLHKKALTQVTTGRACVRLQPISVRRVCRAVCSDPDSHWRTDSSSAWT